MRRAFGVAVPVVAAVLLLAGPPAPLPAPSAASAAEVSEDPLSATLPEAVADAGERKGWDRVDGRVEFGRSTVLYAFWVNPRFNGYYQITQYRMWRTDHSEGETEKVIWNATPGERRPLQVFELVDGVWRRIPPGTPLYDREMMHVIKIYELHNVARGGGGFDRR